MDDLMDNDKIVYDKTEIITEMNPSIWNVGNDLRAKIPWYWNIAYEGF